MEYEEWQTTVPPSITSDALWRSQAYRLGLYAADLGWRDVSELLRDRRTTALADQLYRALGSIGANIAEGFSRGTGKDRARFYEYALGSARESRDWYYKARYVLPEQVTAHRFRVLSQIIRLLLVMVPEQRGRAIREETLAYELTNEPS